MDAAREDVLRFMDLVYDNVVAEATGGQTCRANPRSISGQGLGFGCVAALGLLVSLQVI